MPSLDERFVLCYVREPWVYFTTLPVEEQWGDDWGDVSYEHNAGEPYRRSYRRPELKWEIAKVALEGDYETPSTYTLNSGWSVGQINKRKIPWLRTDRHSDKPMVQIWAGATFPEFMRLAKEAGWTVYLPAEPPT